jgi:hypothetical protein
MLTLQVLTGWLAVWRLPVGTPFPELDGTGPITSITITEDEISIVCAESEVPDHPSDGELPDGSLVEPGWVAMRVEGTLDFGLTGILASITLPLAEADVSIFALSTYDTDYVLVKAAELQRAIAALEAAGHLVRLL